MSRSNKITKFSKKVAQNLLIHNTKNQIFIEEDQAFIDLVYQDQAFAIQPGQEWSRVIKL